MKSKSVIWINIILPLIIGAIGYYIMSPDVFFVRCIDSLLGIKHVSLDLQNTGVLYDFFRGHFFDALWGYALVFALFLIIGNKTAAIPRVLLLVFAFSATLELLQLTSITRGTFDVIDIVTEFLAETAAVFIIYRIYQREGKIK